MTTFGGQPGTTERGGERGASRRRVAAIHRQGTRWSLVVATSDGKIEISEARTLEANELAPVLTQLVKKGGVDRVVGVLPGGASVVRTVSLPEGTSGELAGAAQLMGEAQLAEGLPSYRRGAGVIPEPARSGGRTGLLTAWTDGGEADKAFDLPVDATWTTPVAALAFLRGASAASALYADPADGSIAVLADGGERTHARVLREDNSSPAAWSEAVNGAVMDTGGAAVAVDAQTPTLALDREGLARLKGIVVGLRDERAWLSSYALCVGAILMVATGGEGAGSLAALRGKPPRRQESVPERVLAWVASPARAWALIAAAILLIAFAPLGLAYGRYKLLEHKAAALSSQQSGRAELERNAALYRQLEKSRLPMAKLLATVSVATPQNIVATSVRLSPDQGLSMQGLAKSAKDVNELQANLNGTGVFSDIKINRTSAKGDEGVEFDISADSIKDAFGKFQPKDDWAKQPLAVRLHGEGASNLHVASPEKKDRRASRRSTSSDEEKSDEKSAESSRRPSDKAEGPPPPLTDEEINKMDRATAMKEFASRRKHTSTPTLDKATKDRLAEEAEKLKERMKSAAASPAPAGKDEKKGAKK